MPRKKERESTFQVRLKGLAEVVSREPHVGIEIAQPACFGRAVLILSEEDITQWEMVLARGRAVIWLAREKSDGAADEERPAGQQAGHGTGEPVSGSGEDKPDRLSADKGLERQRQ